MSKWTLKKLIQEPGTEMPENIFCESFWEITKLLTSVCIDDITLYGMAFYFGLILTNSVFIVNSTFHGMSTYEYNLFFYVCKTRYTFLSYLSWYYCLSPFNHVIAINPSHVQRLWYGCQKMGHIDDMLISQKKLLYIQLVIKSNISFKLKFIEIIILILKMKFF